MLFGGFLIQTCVRGFVPRPVRPQEVSKLGLQAVLRTHNQGHNPRYFHTFLDEDAMRWLKGAFANCRP